MAAGVVLAVAFGTATPALAASSSWGPLSSTYDGEVRVSGSGVFYNSGNTAESQMTVTDEDNFDGNNVYGHTEFYWYSLGDLTWHLLSRKSTSEWSSGTHTQTLPQSYSG